MSMSRARSFDDDGSRLSRALLASAVGGVVRDVEGALVVVDDVVVSLAFVSFVPLRETSRRLLAAAASSAAASVTCRKYFAETWLCSMLIIVDTALIASSRQRLSALSAD